MIDIVEWWKKIDGSNQNWLICGKGPSFGRFSEIDTVPYYTLALNHAVSEGKFNAVSVTDIEIVRDLQEVLENHAEYVLMPRRVIKFVKVTEQKLEDTFGEFPVLKRLSDANRLIWYNGMGEPVEGSIQVPYGPQNGGMMVSMICELGGSFIRHIGIDGGSGQSQIFDSVGINKNPVFQTSPRDMTKQFEFFAEAALKYNVDIASVFSNDIFFMNNMRQISRSRFDNYENTLAAHQEHIKHLESRLREYSRAPWKPILRKLKILK